jgi:hypothetical protein
MVLAPVPVQISMLGVPRSKASACDTVGASAANNANSTANHIAQGRCSGRCRGRAIRILLRDQNNDSEFNQWLCSLYCDASRSACVEQAIGHVTFVLLIPLK